MPRTIIKQHNITQTFNLHGVEIFATGTWNMETYTEKDLDSMIEAFKEIVFKPPIKIGHNDIQEQDWAFVDGRSTIGWVNKIYRQGNKLLADFSDLPEKVYEALNRGNYKRVTEIYVDFEVDERVYPYVLKAIVFEYKGIRDI